MSQAKTFVVGCLLFVLAFCYGSSTRASAQTKTPSESVQSSYEKTLQQLLAEVRELRLAVQRATESQMRFQMLIERVKVEQGNVDSIRRQLENLRSQLADMRASKPQFEQQIKEAEQLLDGATDPNSRQDLDSRIKRMKLQIAQFGPEEERLRNREVALEAELQTSQGKLNALNDQLDTLFNELKRP